MGFPCVNSAKYLGVPYNNRISIKFSLQKFKPKIKFIFSKMYNFLKRAGFRERFNIWQLFISPLIRMCLSICGIAHSHTAKSNIETIQNFARSSLKKFCLAPRCAPSELFDYMIGLDHHFVSTLQNGWSKKALKHTEENWMSSMEGYMQYEYE